MFVIDCIFVAVGVIEYVVDTARCTAAPIDVLRIGVSVDSPRVAVAAATSALERGQVVGIQGRVEVVVVVRVRRQDQRRLHQGHTVRPQPIRVRVVHAHRSH